MIFTKLADTLHPSDAEAASFLIQAPEGAQLEFKVITGQRTGKQNNAIHAFLRELASALNEHGFDMLSFPWKEGAEIPWSLELAKSNLWCPLQQAITGKKHTSDLDRKEVDQVYQVLARKIAGMGVPVPPMGRE